MTVIAPFKGVRYNQEKVKNYSKVFAPPYDVISEKEQKQLYAQHPLNVVRLILGKTSAKDNARANRYTRAGEFFKKWEKEGLLVQDEVPGIYLYTQDYVFDGKKKKRIGFIACLKFEDNGKGCLPHEHTLAKPKQDRLMLMRQVHANLSPIFSFYLDPRGEIERQFRPYMKNKSLVSFTDKEKIKHRFWKIDDKHTIDKVCRLMRTKHVFIADGHHRYEVSRAFRQEMRAGRRGKENGYDFVMMYFTGFNEDNLSVMPTHRMVKNIPGLEEKLALLEDYFKIIPARNLKEMLAAQKKTSGFSLGMFFSHKYSVLKMKDRALLGRLMRKSPAQWRRLDVAMLNTVVFEHVFKLNEKQKEEQIGYTRDADFAVQCVNKKIYDVAFFPNATKAQQVKKIALSRSRMPQKSTYFYPKPISGLVINKLC